MNHTAPCFTDDVVCFGSQALPNLLHTFFFQSFWYRLILISAVQRMLFQKCSGFFRCFLAKCNQALFAACGEPLYLLWWSLLLIVDFDRDTSASWRVFFSWLDVVKGIFFTMERILRASTTVVLCGRPGLFMLLSSPVCSFFLRMYQTVDLATSNVPAIFLMDLFCFWSLIIVCFTCMKSSFDRMMWFTATASKCKWNT